MRLGNTAGKNKGKKYLKITGNETITAENQGKADHFSHWFGENYKRLRTELIQKGTLDEDVLSETYLRIHDKIIYGGLVILDYKAYFHRAFFTNFMQLVIQLSKGIVSGIDGLDILDEANEAEQVTKTKAELETDILDYVYGRYPVREFELFKMYVTLKPAINYAQLSTITSISSSCISETISKIRRDICANQAFVQRRKAVG